MQAQKTREQIDSISPVTLEQGKTDGRIFNSTEQTDGFPPMRRTDGYPQFQSIFASIAAILLLLKSTREFNGNETPPMFVKLLLPRNISGEPCLNFWKGTDVISVSKLWSRFSKVKVSTLTRKLLGRTDMLLLFRTTCAKLRKLSKMPSGRNDIPFDPAFLL